MTSPVTRVAAPLRQQVAEGLRELVRTGEYGPGERLVEAQLCERFDVSRTVVREALRQLEAEGLVEVRANRGPVVVELDEHDVAELYEVRRSLEGLAGRLFALDATDAECAALQDQMRVLERTLESLDAQARLEAKDAFYYVLLRGAHNRTLQRMLASVHGRTQLFRGYSLQAPGRPAESLRELAQITEAAAVRRDPAAAQAACEAHIERAAELTIREIRARANPR